MWKKLPADGNFHILNIWIFLVKTTRPNLPANFGKACAYRLYKIASFFMRCAKRTFETLPNGGLGMERLWQKMAFTLGTKQGWHEGSLFSHICAKVTCALEKFRALKLFQPGLGVGQKATVGDGNRLAFGNGLFGLDYHVSFRVENDSCIRQTIVIDHGGCEKQATTSVLVNAKRVWIENAANFPNVL